MKKNRVFKDLKLEMPYLEMKHIKVIDVMKLLVDISEVKPPSIEETLRIILAQQQYDLIVGE